jgi:hypothetical protein
MRLEPPELRDGAVHHRGHLGVVAHIATDSECLVTGAGQLLRCCFQRFFFEVR